MIAVRYFAVFIFLALLTGCGTPCPVAGGPSAYNHRCYYHIKINKIHPGNHVEGTDLRTNETSTFRVRDVDVLTSTNQLKEGSDYYFNSESGSAYLELYTETTSGAMKKEIETR